MCCMCGAIQRLLREPSMTSQPSCSIIIPCFNKASVVSLAIDSALRQDYSNVEVIVVDDGSTDNSQEVLKSYETRVLLIKKQNGGQASAMNAGFLHSRGDIVLFLDGDDLLDSNTVTRVVGVWSDQISKVQYRLRIIDSTGNLLKGLLPPYKPLLEVSDNDQAFCRFGFYPSPPESGNAFSRWYLEAVMPIPELPYRSHGELLLLGTAPLFGQVLSLEGIAGSWRRDANNESKTGGLDKAEVILRCGNLFIEMARTRSLAASRRSPLLNARLESRWPSHLKNLLIITKFRPRSELAMTRVCQAAILYLQTIFTWPEYNWKQKARFTMWCIIMTCVPRMLLRRVPGITHPLVPR